MRELVHRYIYMVVVVALERINISIYEDEKLFNALKPPYIHTHTFAKMIHSLMLFDMLGLKRKKLQCVCVCV